MNKRFSAAFLTLALALSLCACGGSPARNGELSDAAQASDGQAHAQAVDEQDAAQSVAEPSTPERAAPKTVKVGLICTGDENELSETYNFIRGKNDASVMLAAEGVDAEWVVKWSVPESADAERANQELAADGCQLIVNTAPGYEEFMLNVAPEYPDIQFVACGGRVSRADDLPNTHNAYANIHEGRYLAGVVAGLKLQELLDAGTIAPEEAVIGYIGASDNAETVSAYTAYFLGARSVCPDVIMKVLFAGTRLDDAAERNAASALAGMGCQVISQQSGAFIPAAVAQSAGILHTGYNNDMTPVAPGASLVSTRIDWYAYFDRAIRAILNGDELEQDWSHGLDAYAVELTPLNRDLIADGTDETLDEVKAALADGSLQAFDTSTFTVNGETITHAFALDTDGDSVPDAQEAVFDGAFHESYFQSAPYFALDIDGIEKLN